MKNNFTLTFVLVIFVSFSPLYSQLDFGFSGSFNMSKLSGDFRSSEEIFPVVNVSGGIGSVLCVNIVNNFAIQFEPMFMERGGQNGYAGASWEKIHLSYFDLPVFIKYTYKKPYFLVGFIKSFLLTAHILQGRNERHSIKNAINGSDSGLSLGVGIDIPAGNSSKFMFELNYFKGFSNLKSVTDYTGDQLKIQGINGKVGILFELNLFSGNDEVKD